MPYTVSKTSNRTATPIVGLLTKPLDHYHQWEWIDEFLDAYYDAWPRLPFWRALSRVRFVDPAHPEAPPAFKSFLPDGSLNPDIKQSLYWPGDRSIDVSTDYAAELLALLAHELGHHWQHHYTERIATNIGALMLRRLGQGPAPGAIEVYAAEVQRG